MNIILQITVNHTFFLARMVVWMCTQHEQQVSNTYLLQIMII